MQHIDERQLEDDLQYRYRFLCQFIGFEPSDAEAIHAAAPHLGPLVMSIVERTYDKLLAFDATARHFLPPQSGFDGPAASNLAELSAQAAPIQFRKEHLSRYLLQLLGRSYEDAKFPVYLDMVGKIHTPLAGNAQIQVPLVQMNALMGWLADILSEAISELGLPSAETVRTLRAFQKLLWIQNDFINRHYTRG
ncbi:MAG: protoglobin family protein [Planctomycetales bacterium]